MGNEMVPVRVVARALKAWSEWHNIGAIVKLPVDIARALINNNEAEPVKAKGGKPTKGA